MKNIRNFQFFDIWLKQKHCILKVLWLIQCCEPTRFRFSPKKLWRGTSGSSKSLINKAPKQHIMEEEQGKSEGKKAPLLERKGNIVGNICLNMNKHTNDLESWPLEWLHNFGHVGQIFSFVTKTKFRPNMKTSTLGALLNHKVCISSRGMQAHRVNPVFEKPSRQLPTC